MKNLGIKISTKKDFIFHFIPIDVALYNPLGSEWSERMEH